MGQNYFKAATGLSVNPGIMRKEDVKNGTAVYLKDEVFSLMRKNGRITIDRNSFVVIGGGCNRTDIFTLSPHPYYCEGVFSESCDNFEPYVEASSEQLEPGNFLKHPWRTEMINQAIEDALPITQEFIESFGFEYATSILHGVYLEDRIYCKHSENPKITVLFMEHLMADGETKYSCTVDDLSPFMEKEREYLFNNYTCHTRAELRFLLTKGRIDCSK